MLPEMPVIKEHVHPLLSFDITYLYSSLSYHNCRSSFDYQMQKRAEAEETLKQYVSLYCYICQYLFVIVDSKVGVYIYLYATMY